MPGPYQIAIVGCGIAGAATAYLLARDGHQVTVLEQAPALGAAGAGVILQSSGQEVLRRLGLLDVVLARSAPLDELYARHAGGEEMICHRYTDFEPGCRAYGVHRGVLFEALLSAAQTQPINFRLGCRVITRTIESDRAWLTDAIGRRHGPFDFILATDGARSVLRVACGFSARVVSYSHGTLWLIAPGQGVTGRLLQVVQGTRKLFGLLPLGDGLCTLYWGLPITHYDALKTRGLNALKQEILVFAPEAAAVLDHLCDFDQLLLTSYQHVSMPRWHDNHMLFLGDAAHAMSPHLGQGMNLALVDAYRFADCLRSAATPQVAFRAFRTRQRAYLRYYAAVTFMLAPFFQSDWAILGWGRDWALPLLPRIPWVKRQMLLTVAGLKSDFFGGRVRI